MKVANTSIPDRARNTSFIRPGCCLILEVQVCLEWATALFFMTEIMPENQDEGQQQKNPAGAQAKATARDNFSIC